MWWNRAKIEIVYFECCLKGDLLEMKLFIGIVPPDEYKAKLLTFQQQWPENKLPGRIEPHITVKAPFDPPKNNSWIEEIGHLCERTPIFSVVLGSPSSFGERVIYLSVKSETLFPLHQEVIRVFTETTGFRVSQSEGKTYTPHLTLGNTRHGLTSAQIMEMGVKASHELVPYPAFHVHFLRVYEKKDRFTPWSKMIDLPLQK